MARECHHAVSQSSGWRNAAAADGDLLQTIGTGAMPDLPGCKPPGRRRCGIARAITTKKCVGYRTFYSAA
ncbi:hypothetical protein AzCIB_4467 [Azoarcus sp. CIB]|nr:hypothetical protein AzCIB_4467 [Azoarcus sp. CIB]